MNRFFQKRLRDAERDFSYSNVFYRINTESQARKAAALCVLVPGLLAVFYLIAALLMLSGVVPAPAGVIAVDLLSGAVAAWLAWQLYRAPRLWTMIAALVWLLIEFVRTMAGLDPQGPGSELFVGIFVLTGFAGILALRGVRKLTQFSNSDAAS